MKIFQPTEEDKANSSAPVDYSFRRLTVLEDLEDLKPRVFRLGRAALRGENQRFLTRGLWFNHNRLPSVENIYSTVVTLVEQPSAIAWLDFSFNRIVEINEEITNLTGLMMLYFHGNKIHDITQVAKLGKLPKLKNVTMYGNPIETTPGYRGHILVMLPQIRHLDFAGVVPSERTKAAPYALKKPRQRRES